MAVAAKPKRKIKPPPKTTRTGRQPKFWSYEKDRTKFRGEYIAYEGDRIFAHGDDAREVLAAARRYADNPTLQKVMHLRTIY